MSHPSASTPDPEPHLAGLGSLPEAEPWAPTTQWQQADTSPPSGGFAPPTETVAPPGLGAPPTVRPAPFGIAPMPGSASALGEPATPRYSGLRGIAAAICITLAVLLTIPAMLAQWVRSDVTSPGGFADNAVAALDVAEVRSQVGDLLVAELLWGAEAPEEQVVGPVVAAVVDEWMQTDSFEEIWRDASLQTHDAIMDSLSGRGQGPGVDEAAIVVEPPLAELAAALEEIGVDAGFDVMDVEPLEIVLADLPTEDDVGGIGSTVSRVDSAGLWLPIVVVLLFAAGLAAAVNRWRSTIVAGVGLAVCGAIVLVSLSATRGLAADAMASAETLDESGVESLIEVFTGRLGTISTALIVIGVVGITTGIGGLVWRSRRP